MCTYNITTISFLVNSFTDIVDSYGAVNKTVDLYKRQVEAMVSANMLNAIDRDIVYELLGVVNTSNIKWSIADSKINQFLYTVNMLGDMRDEASVNNILNRLVHTNSITESVANIVKKIYKQGGN